MDILQELDKAGAVYLDRHFIYTSGKHGSGYINLDPIYTNVSLGFRPLPRADRTVPWTS